MAEHAGPETLSFPEPPGELWGLWDGAGWVASIDDAPGGETYLVALSEAEARAAARHQRDVYAVDCRPVRLI